MRIALLIIVSWASWTQAAECRAKTFETKLVREACEDGGQKAARDAMKQFVKRAREQDPSLECKSCHSTLTPNYESAKDALKIFRKLGGE